MRRLVSFLIVALLFPLTALAQGGCPTDTGGPAVVLNPRTLQAELTEHTATLPDGTATVTAYALGWYAQGATAPTSGTAIPKASFALVSGTQYCYQTTLPDISGIPIGAPYVAVLKAVRATDGTESAWSAPSNPFARVGPPASPAKVTLRKQGIS
jgi:hypothetical protein